MYHRLLYTHLHHSGDRTIPNPCPGTKSELEQSAALRKKPENDEKIVKTGSSREGIKRLVRTSLLCQQKQC